MFKTVLGACALSVVFIVPLQAAGPVPTSQEIVEALRPSGLEDRSQIGARTLVPDDGERGVTVEGGDPVVPSIDLQVAFEFDSAVLLNEALLTLERLGDALTHESFADTRFRIIGHTDARGTVEYNDELSLRRANAVVDYLVTHYQLPRDRLDVDGMGKAMLLPGIHPEDERNRRVEIQNIGS